jgi:hypothetical protein
MMRAMTTLVDVVEPVKQRRMEVVVEPAEQRLMEVVAKPAEQRLAEILATLRWLRIDQAITLDDALYVKDGGFTYLSFGRVVDGRALAMALTVNRSYALTVEVDRRTTCREGLLLSYDTDSGGFVFYVHDNRLVYEYTCAGAVYTVRSDKEVPTGPATLRLVFTKTGHLQGLVALYINDGKVGEVAIPHLWPYVSAGQDRVNADAGRTSWGNGEKDERSFTGTIKAIMITGVLSGAAAQTGPSRGRWAERHGCGESRLAAGD